ncbi:hypothetical protein [Solitalea canadensis]|uniref:Uncharacterized protein n=1 Tax=Solitalea canadensis (strain ATCC 29591 / DSM 3403 / JCM 21819 / LMG 8368 / NBRC 15130 / NCIMB 12057 / USAM 9D) TaxID=929556 RepID=H8KLK1_SOLCM|nr:hypothetical protein [Solitalea canadensis]AFD08888.1 hypothetical protein Solca_3892 [Solitalea canadensis DSM 3403]
MTNDKKSVEIPESDPQMNKSVEELNVTMQQSDLQNLVISRTTILSGHLKETEQKRLLLMEDYSNAEAILLNEKYNQEALLAKSSKGRKAINEYRAACDKAEEN